MRILYHSGVLLLLTFTGVRLADAPEEIGVELGETFDLGNLSAPSKNIELQLLRRRHSGANDRGYSPTT